MSNARKRQVPALGLLFLFAWYSASFAQSAPATKTQFVMLGTGTPLPDPQRSGDSSPAMTSIIFIRSSASSRQRDSSVAD
jgi:hypothetical protein